MRLTLTDAELAGLLADMESDRVERKERLAGDAPTKLREAVCAFANDLPDHRQPGVAFIGVNDAGRPVGLPITDELLRNLADIKTDGQIQPLPSMSVEKRVVAGTELAVVTVAPADAPPVTYRGRVWVRIGPRRAIATKQDEGILNERRRFRDLPFDLQPIVTAKVGDLSQRLFEEEYLAGAVAPDILASNDRTYLQRLAATRMIPGESEPTPTLTGVLTLSPRARDFVPGAYVQFLRVDGGALGDPIADERVIDGPLAELIRRLDDTVRAHVRTRIDVTTPLETRTPDYPAPALEQLSRNAIMHRSYEGTNAPVRVTWFDDRVEVQSPGGPFGVVTPQTFGRPGLTDYRNPTIAEAMKHLGFVQRFGVGIATANRLLRDNGNPPIEWVVDDRNVLAIVRRAA
jgi:ATP-dependent DNA helicase RecG